MRLIDADELGKKACAVCGYGDGEGACAILCGLAKVIDSIPTIEAEPVRHGEWIHMVFTDTGKSAGYKCSECGLGARKKFAYCHCGAKMAGGEGNET